MAGYGFGKLYKIFKLFDPVETFSRIWKDKIFTDFIKRRFSLLK